MSVLQDDLGLHSRLTRLRLMLRFADEPLARVLLGNVIADIEQHIALVEETRQPHSAGADC